MQESRWVAGSKMVAVVLAWMVVCPGPAGGAQIVLGGSCDLPYAVEAANNDAPSLYCPAGSGADVIVLTGDEDLDSIWAGSTATPPVTSEIVVDGRGYDIRRIDNELQQRLFQVAAGGDLTIMNAILKDGRAPVGDGGAVLNEGTLKVVGSQFWGNIADFFGGAIANDGTLTVEDSLFFNNSTTTSGSRGGAISSGADCSPLCAATIARTEFLDNSSARGGGIFNEETSFLFVSDSTFDGNSVTGGWGGGVWNRGVANIGRTLFYDNSAASGSAVFNEGVSATISNSTFASNVSSSFGSVVNLSGTLTIRQSTFSNNTATSVGATSSAVGGDPGDTTEVGGSVFDGNSGAPDCDVNVTSLGFNFGCGSAAATNVASTLSWNGGYTRVIELLPGSSAIDAGGSCGYGTDQRGVGRDDPCESGAFEFGECQDEHLRNASIGGTYEEEACEFLFASDVDVNGPAGDLTLRAGSRISIWDMSVEEGATLTLELDPTLLP